MIKKWLIRNNSYDLTRLLNRIHILRIGQLDRIMNRSIKESGSVEGSTSQRKTTRPRQRPSKVEGKTDEVNQHGLM